MKTYLAKNGEVKRDWWIVDAEGQTLGRLATQVASVLRGKNKPEFTQNVDIGDFVIVINSEKVVLTGKKELQKVYSRHSGISGGFKQETVEHLRKRFPEQIVEKAVRGMIPHTTLGQEQFMKLKVYKGSNHPHKSQNPKKLELIKKAIKEKKVG